MKKKILTIGIILVAFWFAGSFSAAFAIPITIESNPSVSYQQTENSPCVIGNSSCKNDGFIGNEYPSTPAGNNGTYDLFSPVYFVGNGPGIADPNIIPSSFMIGIDVNFAAGQGLEALEFFKVLTSSAEDGMYTVDANNSYAGPTDIDVHNGNGYSDALLKGFSISPGTYVMFEASVSNDTAGMEQFFLIPQATPTVPEPMSLVLLGAGLVVIAGFSKKLRRTRK